MTLSSVSHSGAYGRVTTALPGGVTTVGVAGEGVTTVVCGCG